MKRYRWGSRLVTVVSGDIAQIHPEGTAQGNLAPLPKKLRPKVRRLTSGVLDTVAPATDQGDEHEEEDTSTG